MPRRALASIALALVLIGSSTNVALAQSNDAAAIAESLFVAGRKLLEEGKLAEACAKFEESNRLDPSAGTLLNLGRCFEAQGKLASAWATYKRAATVGRSAGQNRQVTAAEQAAEKLDSRLARLLVRMDAPPEGVRVRRSDTELGAASLGSPIAVDAGTYAMRVEAPGYEPWTGTIVVAGEGTTTELVVPALTKRASPSPATNAPAPAPAKASSADRATKDEPSSALLVGGLIASGVGVVGAGIGAVFGAITLADAATAESDPSLCPKRRCSPEGLAWIDATRTEALVSTASFVAGGVALAAGGAMIAIHLAGDEASSATTRATIAPFLGPSVAGLAIGGAW
jgi:Tfp pilus assembly protein PilF